MRVRDRQLATAIIWGILFFVLAALVPRLLEIRADLSTLLDGTGLSTSYVSVVDTAQINDALAIAQARAPEAIAQAQQMISEQMAARMPIFILITLGLIAVATIGTWLVWRHAGLEAKLALDLLSFEKAKRRSRIERFIDELDGDEMDELRAHLDSEGAEQMQSSGRG